MEHFLILASANTGCISTSTFACLLACLLASSAIGLKVCAIAAGIKKYKSIIKRKKKKHDNIVLLPKSKLNSIEVLISKALTNSNIGHDEFVLINNMPKAYDNMKEEIKTVHQRI